MLRIDGSKGEGGGQILRSSLALAAVTGRPVRVDNVRAGRSKPGLMRQHLTALRAVAEVCGGAVIGDQIGSRSVELSPGPIKAGQYTFRIGTAGSTALVLQAVLPALLMADAPSRVTLEGGTHNPFAPPHHFLCDAFLPLLARMGAKVEAVLERPGFFPAGGGRMVVDIHPADEGRLAPIEIMERGAVSRRRAVAMVSNLPKSIAERELKVVRRKLGWTEDECEVIEWQDGPGPGNILSLTVESEGCVEVCTGFGERDRPAEAVASHAVQQMQRYLRSGAPVGEYLADQLLLPLAIAGQGQFHAQCLSRHTATHIELLKQFYDLKIETQQLGRDGAIIRLGRA